MDEIFWVDPATLTVHKPSFLGVATVRAMQQKWTASLNRSGTRPASLWSEVDYVMYTVADQVLHARPRHREKLFAALAATQPGASANREPRHALLTPHRLNAVPRSQDFDELVGPRTPRGSVFF